MRKRGRECSRASHNYQRRVGVPGYVGTGLTRLGADTGSELPTRRGVDTLV
jgi:hypothetical protein